MQTRPVYDQILSILNERFTPVFIKLEDQSDRHIRHAGHDERGESHFHLEMSADSFNGLTRVARQRCVNEALSDLLKERVHAFSMVLSGTEG